MNYHSLIAAAALAVGIPGGAVAQDWTFDASLYGWLPGLTTTIDTPFGEVESSGGGGDILENLDMTFMGTFQAHRDRWSILLDVLYVDLSKDVDSPLELVYEDAELELKVAALSGYALYNVVDDPHVAFDAGLGFRSFSLDIDIGLDSDSAAKDQEFSADATWTVPLVIGRVVVPFDDTWYAKVAADLGATTDDSSTWQVFTSVGYRFNENWSTELGYRYMNIQKEVGGFNVDLGLGGMLLGATYRF